MAKNIVTIPSKITKGEELVVIPRSLYEKFYQKKQLLSLSTLKPKLKALGKKISQKDIEKAIQEVRKKYSL